MKCRSCDREAGLGNIVCWVCYFNEAGLHGRVRSVVIEKDGKDFEHIVIERFNELGEIRLVEAYESQPKPPLCVSGPWFTKVSPTRGADFKNLRLYGDWLHDHGYKPREEKSLRPSDEKVIVLHFFGSASITCTEHAMATLRYGKQFEVKDLIINDILADGRRITKIERLSALK